MCGEDSTIRIKRVGNGFTIDAYTPGGKDKPGSHKESVATKPEHVLRAVASHIGGRGGKKRKGVAILTEGEPAMKQSKKKGRKTVAYKRA